MLQRASDTGGVDHLSDALKRFRCCKDKDIEDFLHDKAVDFLQRGWCSVYLIVDESAFDSGEIKIDAYFTLSHKSLIPDAASKNSIYKASGFKDSDSIHFVLIGQLGKYIEDLNDGTTHSAAITSTEILDFAFDIIRAASDLIPCRCVLGECSENPKVQQVYKDYHFSEFQYDGEHYQFYKRL